MSYHKTAASMKDFEFRVIDSVSTHDVTAVTAEVHLPGEEVIIVSGSARKDPADKYKAEVGFYLALSRALEQAATRLRRRGNGLVKQADDIRSLRAAQAQTKDSKKASKVLAG